MGSFIRLIYLASAINRTLLFVSICDTYSGVGKYMELATPLSPLPGIIDVIYSLTSKLTQNPLSLNNTQTINKFLKTSIKLDIFFLLYHRINT